MAAKTGLETLQAIFNVMAKGKTFDRLIDKVGKYRNALIYILSLRSGTVTDYLSFQNN
jgi:hypothetical protein